MFFSFQSQLYFSRVHLKIHKTFSYNHPQIICLFSVWGSSQIVNIEYPQWIWSLISLMKIFMDCLHIHPFFNRRFNDSINNVRRFIWLHILIKFQCIIIFKWHYDSTKIFIFTYFFMRLKLLLNLRLKLMFSVLREWR